MPASPPSGGTQWNGIVSPAYRPGLVMRESCRGMKVHSGTTKAGWSCLVVVPERLDAGFVGLPGWVG